MFFGRSIHLSLAALMLSPTYTKAFHEQPPVCDSDVGYQ
jgi:hypothetical protein